MSMVASVPAVHISVDNSVDIAHQGFIISPSLDVKVKYSVQVIIHTVSHSNKKIPYVSIEIYLGDKNGVKQP